MAAERFRGFFGYHSPCGVMVTRKGESFPLAGTP